MNNIENQTTIIARCTPRGRGTLAIIRISGTDALEITEKFAVLPSKQTIISATSHTIKYGHVIDKQGEKIDQVLFLIMHTPKTFTGQNTVEITCHNNPLIVEGIIERAIECGARLAEPGEFSKRAFLNKKMDLIQAETINDLINAETQATLKTSLAQLHGSLSHCIQNLENSILEIITLCQASFEFLDREINFDANIKTKLYQIEETISELKHSHSKQRYIREGIRIALIGSVNAGKSSLFNALLRRDRAIVTKQAGTTRDTIEGNIYRDGTSMTLVDTAGLRKTENAIEKKGIERSYQEAQRADIILLVIDSTAALADNELSFYTDILDRFPDKCIVIHNKVDLSRKNTSFGNYQAISTSCTKNRVIKKLEECLQRKIRNILEQHQPAFLLNERHYNLVVTLEKKIEKTRKLMQDRPHHELIVYELKEALSHIAQLTGKTIDAQSLGLIFSSFCIGK